MLSYRVLVGDTVNRQKETVSFFLEEPRIHEMFGKNLKGRNIQSFPKGFH